MNIAKVIFSQMKNRVPILILTCLLATSATAQVNYAVDGSTAYVTHSPYASGNIVIASTFNGYPVTSIGYGAFSGCTSLTSLTIPNSVTNIGGFAFYYCTSLTSVTIPNSVTYIGDYAFQYCTSLTSVTIPNSVTNIANSAFDNCTSLTNVTIPDSVVSIEGFAFQNCTNLTSVTIPNSVTNIRGSAFDYCTSLTNFSVGAANSVYSSLDGVLFNKAQTTLTQFPRGRGGSYAIPNGVANIGPQAFYSCTSLTNVTIANSVTNIGRLAFYYCASLTSVMIPNSVTSIGDYTFAISGLTSVTIPSSLTYIADSAFYYCTSLTSVTIPNSVTFLGSGAFYFCTNLTSVTIPNSVLYLYGAFTYCTSLTNFSVGAANSVYSSPDGVLFNKAQTTLIQFPGGRGGSYAIPNSVTNMWSGAFSDCHRLTSITIPNSVIGIFSGFGNCTSLTNFSVGGANLVYSSLEGVLFNKAQTTLIQFPGGRGGSYAIPNNVTNIEAFAFRGCANLTNVTIGNGVTILQDYAFSDCYGLTSVTIPNNVTAIWAAFTSCTNLTNVTIPNSVTYIANNAFASCTSLTSVTIPYSVTDLGYFAFFNCTSMTNFSVDAANAAYSSLDGVLLNKAQTQIIQFPGGRSGSYTVPSSVAYITDYAFYSATRLTNVTFLGNAPSGFGGFISAGAKVYYYYGTTGWGGLPAVMLGAPAPQVGAGSAGVKPGGFGFTLNGVVNQTIAVEASTNLVNWQPIWTKTLSTISTNFVDPDWVNHPHRFYRLRSN